MSELTASLNTAISLTSKSIDTIKKLHEIAEQTENLELKEGILNVKVQLADTKEQLVNLKDENANLKEENRQLKEKIQKLEEKTEEVKFVDGLYYEVDNEDGPYCTNCYDNEEKKIRLQDSPAPFLIYGKYKCPSCGNYFKPAK